MHVRTLTTSQSRLLNIDHFRRLAKLTRKSIRVNVARQLGALRWTQNETLDVIPADQPKFSGLTTHQRLAESLVELASGVLYPRDSPQAGETLKLFTDIVIFVAHSRDPEELWIE